MSTNANIVDGKGQALASVDTSMNGLNNPPSIYYHQENVYGYQLTSQLTQIADFYEEHSQPSKITWMDILVTVFFVLTWSGVLFYFTLNKIAVI